MSSLASHRPAPAPQAWIVDPVVVALRRRVALRLSGLIEGSDPASRAVRDLLGAGGKRLRPLLVYLGGQLAGARLDQLDALAEAAELVHVASLLHDDLMDGAETRRGQPAAWRSIGPKAAVLGGDLAHVLALQRVRLAPDPSLAHFLGGIEAMVRSQALETEQEACLAGGLPAWRAVAFGKTAALCGWCAEVGALAAGRPELADPLRRFGQGLGLAFQAVDDLLDLTPGMDPGKRPFADLRARVPSLPIRLAAAADPRIAQAVLELWRGGGEPLPALLGSLRSAGIPPAADLVERELDHARAALDALPEAPQRELLHAMLDTLSLRAAACLASPEPSLEAP
jgi:geranylgeranyl pyrophosphate synthase